MEQHGGGQPFLALRIFAGSPPGPQGPDRADLLVALALHENGALAFGGPLFDIGGDNEDTDSDSGMSVQPEEDDDDDDAIDVDDDEVQIVYECITLD